MVVRRFKVDRGILTLSTGGDLLGLRGLNWLEWLWRLQRLERL